MVGRRAPGARLVERDIAKELNVSRLPVREAIRKLVAEGIVTARPRTWAIVRTFDERDIQDFAEVREAIETLIFVFAAQRHDEAGLAALRAALDREIEAGRNGDVMAGRAAAGEFHEIVARLAGNDMLQELIDVFITRLRWLFGQHDDIAAMAAEHEKLFRAIAARDTEALKVLVPAHLEEGKQVAEEHLRSGRVPVAE